MGTGIPFRREERFEFHVDLSYIHIDKKIHGPVCTSTKRCLKRKRMGNFQARLHPYAAPNKVPIFILMLVVRL